jgi:hypothetical protein
MARRWSISSQHLPEPTNEDILRNKWRNLESLALVGWHLRGDRSNQSDLGRLAGGTMPFMRKYSTICP